MTIALVLKNIHKAFYEKKYSGRTKDRSEETLSTGAGQTVRSLFGAVRDIFRPADRISVLEDINITVKKGEIFGLLGPNGSGKSTLIRLVSTLLLPDQGEIMLFGISVVNNPRRVRRYLNRVSVEASLFKKLNAIENLTYAARLYGVEVRSGINRIEKVLSEFGLKERDLVTSMENLSRGMQQKVAIARALLTTPVLLLLDEPTTGLDPRSKREVQEFILKVRKLHNTTVILTTHDMAEAERLCDRIAIISKGRIVACDTCRRLKTLSEKTDPSLEELFLELTGEHLDQ